LKGIEREGNPLTEDFSTMKGIGLRFTVITELKTNGVKLVLSPQGGAYLY